MSNVEHFTYAYIRAWGRLMGWDATRIDEHIALATTDAAPVNAIYKREDDTWATYDDIASAQTRDQMEYLIGAMRRSGG